MLTFRTVNTRKSLYIENLKAWDDMWNCECTRNGKFEPSLVQSSGPDEWEDPVQNMHVGESNM